MPDFEDIRAYRDDEVNLVLRSLQTDADLRAFIRTTVLSKAGLSQPIVWLLFPLVWKFRWRQLIRQVNSIKELQDVVKKMLVKTLARSSEGYSFDGLDALDSNKAYLFISNHRDIAMDPAIINLILYLNRFPTLHIAIGDNLLSKPFAEKLMRINKSFIVRRNIQGKRKLLFELSRLSRYIHQLLFEEHNNVWIAQREGRAKDGIDKTDKALIKMLLLNAGNHLDLNQAVSSLSIIPTAISYEWDPCDADKARAMVIEREEGAYNKQTHEDIIAIGKGITGQKGHIQVSFGTPIKGNYSNTEEVANAIDQQIMSRLRLYPSHYAAYQLLGESSDHLPWESPAPKDISEARLKLQAKTAQLPAEVSHQLLQNYANTLLNKLNYYYSNQGS